MDDIVRQTGRLENMTEKSGLLSVTGITKYKRNYKWGGKNILPYSSIASSAIHSYNCWKIIISLFDTNNAVYKNQIISPI